MTRVLVVDDHPVVRRGFRAMLAGEPWVTGVDEAGTAAEALRVSAAGRAPLVAMDIMLPDGNGIELTERIVRERPDTAVLILTMSDDPGLVSSALRAGARGYLLKHTDPDTVLDALRTVAAGGMVLGPSVALAALRAPAPPQADLGCLTPRERDLLGLLATGASNARMARSLGLAEKTVRNRLSTVLTKLGVADRVQAALLARESGLDAPGA